LITTALKKDKASPEHVQAAVTVMSQLNRTAAQVCSKFRVDAMTDITGFGLVGHALEVAKASQISIRIDHRKLPILPGAIEYSREGFCAGGLTSNRDFFGSRVSISDSVPAPVQNILFDPQTSGGLLIFSHPDDAAKLLDSLHASGVDAVEIGSAAGQAEHPLTVT
jgi:selenide,water dikinase